MFTKKLPISIATFMAASFILLSFEGVRKPGADSLTAAGVASIEIGFAAQRPVPNLLAGLQVTVIKRTYKLRALMSNGISDISRGLRCLVSGRLIFIKQHSILALCLKLVLSLSGMYCQ
ncbi:hypothetical protein [Pontibacter pamirensis]|uniref:hypothetical protein n=1 Tax=Pontibacter pamirensis TaxID=2562824 RepID=UPI001389828B|nr:hypothetical protein [Pontibacter pamirensis]